MSAISANLTAPPDNFSTTLSSGITDTALSIPLNSVSGLPTEGVGVLFTKDADGNVNAGSVEIIHWTGIGGSSLTLTNTGDRGLTGSDAAAQAYSAGAYFEVWVTSYYYKSLRDGIVAIDIGALTAAATSKATPVDADTIPLSDSAASNALKKLTWANLKATLLTWLRLSTTIIPVNAPQGFLINGKISVTDSGSGLVVAVKTLADADPSSTDPVYVRIGNTVRTISAALSRTLADGTNWCNSGGAELATKEVDYFVYLVWDSNSSAVGLGFSRIPFAALVSDFSSTTTNEKYIAGYSDFTSTDEVEVVGRFAATLSAGAGYTWSVPTYTAINLIQRPIYHTRLLDWVPTWTGYSASPSGVNKYQVINDRCYLFQDLSNGTSNATSNRFTVPFIFKLGNVTECRALIGWGVDNGSNQSNPARLDMASATNTLIFSKDGAGNTWTSSGAKMVQVFGGFNYSI